MAALQSGSCAFTLVQKCRDYKPVTYDYWTIRLLTAIENGVWSYYKNEIANLEGEVFRAWVVAPNKQIKHQNWMKRFEVDANRKRIQKFASHITRKSFGSMRDYEMVQSLALIYEGIYEEALSKQFFDWDKFQEATVIEQRGGYFHASVKVVKQDEYNLPPITVNTRF